MERRKFMLKAAIGASAVAISLGYSCQEIEYDSTLAKPQLLSSIWNTETMTEIGKRYQKQYPKENSERKLVQLLSESLSEHEIDMDKALKKRITEDFKTGNIITIDGWILSLTEGRQCALFSLLQPT